MSKAKRSNKVVLITGSARRIGAEIANVLHAANMNIVVHYHQSERAALRLIENLNEIRKNSAIGISYNLQVNENINKLLEKAYQKWGRLDVLINNASRFYRTKMGDVDEHVWQDLMGINIKTPFFLSQAAASMLKKTAGCIVNIADIHAEKPLKDYGVYCISKSGLIMLTKVLAKELAPFVRVNAISPGAIIWPEGKNHLSDAYKQKIIRKTILKRSGKPEDIAKAVLFIIRDAEYMTGQIVTIDGGRTLKT